uniref:Kinesin motor domain-containing protein n=1 Tax=Palpitomonas bilix TaxID=652834 RepID=A0A7S3LWG2_9EUKA|mmetsp:Transcript_5443/g.12310  ORF Transcript_5443/g.12310 Transcript_5443/m.12310 type:complete len:568 (+) Transcript_5443:375-2078(+)
MAFIPVPSASFFSADEVTIIKQRNQEFEKAFQARQHMIEGASSSSAKEEGSKGHTSLPLVYVRVRPLSQSEKKGGATFMKDLRLDTKIANTNMGSSSSSGGGSTSADESEGGNGVAALGKSEKRREELGGFAGVFGPNSDNEGVYGSTILPLLPTTLQGGTVNLFCFGHTGTGKTHTMLGYGSERGLFEKAATTILERLNEINEKERLGANHALFLAVRFTELHLDRVYDLINNRSECTLRESSDGTLHIRDAHTEKTREGRVYAKDQTSVEIRDIPSLLDLLRVCTKRRVVGSSSIHDQSSRSHAILELEIVNAHLLSARGELMEAEAELHRVGKLSDDMIIAMTKDLADIKQEPGQGFTVKCKCETGEMTKEEWVSKHEQLTRDAVFYVEESAKHEMKVKAVKERIQQIVESGPPSLCGRFLTIDLAGNDYDKRDLSQTSPAEKRESTAINKDLLAVKEVLRGIVQKAAKLPFRNSKLTRLLKSSLSPSLPTSSSASSAASTATTRCSATVMLGTVSPSTSSENQTVNTLRYCQMATAKGEKGGSAGGGVRGKRSALPPPKSRRA